MKRARLRDRDEEAVATRDPESRFDRGRRGDRVATIHRLVGNQTVASDGGPASVTVSAPDGPAEQAAERVAEQVMRRSQPEPERSGITENVPPGLLSRTAPSLGQTEDQDETPRNSSAAVIQPKFRVSQPTDKDEKEADRIRDPVMRMPEPTGQESRMRHRTASSPHSQVPAAGGRTRLRLSGTTAELLGIATFGGFGLDESEAPAGLRARIERRAAELADLLRSAPPGSVLVVEGHTDATGSESHNRQLGHERTETVRRALVDAGVPPGLIRTRSRGEADLTVATEGPEPRNRRVTVRLQAPSGAVGLGVGSLSNPMADLGSRPSPPDLFPSLEDMVESPEVIAERNLEWMLRNPPSPVPPGRSVDDLLDATIADVSDDLADAMGIESQWVRDRLRGLIRSGVDRGIDAGIDAGLDGLGLEGEQREAVKQTIDALRQVRPGERPGGERERLQRAPTSTANSAEVDGVGAVPTSAAARIEALRSGGGCPLPASERRFLEPHFGRAVDRVLIHTDWRAQEAAAALDARAFTVGRDIAFGTREYRPGTDRGRRLLAHELTHVVQQTGDGAVASAARRPPSLVQREENGGGTEGEETNGSEQGVPERFREILDKVRNDEELTRGEIEYLRELSPAEVEYFKEVMAEEISRQILSKTFRFSLTYDPSTELRDFEHNLTAGLRLRLGGVIGGVAGSLGGTAESDVTVRGSASGPTTTLVISRPRGSNRMAAMIRQRLFPGEGPRRFTFDDVSERTYRILAGIAFIGRLTFSLTGPGTEGSGAVALTHESFPDDVELVLTLRSPPAGGSTGGAREQGPSDYSLLTPSPRAFAAGGYANVGGRHGLQGTAGLDVPLLYDTSNPLAYAGLGIRGSMGTAGTRRAGGTGFVGLNLDPLSLQLGIGAGVAFLPNPIGTPEGPAQTVAYSELEGAIGYRPISNLELLLLATTGAGEGGGGALPSFGTVQLGAGFRF